jgi:hypothetical protein
MEAQKKFEGKLISVIARRRWSSKPGYLLGCIETKPTKQSHVQFADDTFLVRLLHPVGLATLAPHVIFEMR